MADPKVGTGKKPKGSGRRLYTDENPRDTVSIKYATVQDAKETIAKVKRLTNPMRGRSKSSPFLNNELGLQEKLNKLPLQGRRKSS
jgi:hypothetical protein